MADPPAKPKVAHATATLFEFARETFADEDSAQKCLEYVLRGELDELKQSHEDIHASLQRDLTRYVEFQSDIDARLRKADEDDTIAQDEEMDGNTKIEELEKQRPNLGTISAILGNQLTAVDHLKKTFAQAMRPVSVFGFQMSCHAKNLKQRLKALETRQRGKKSQIDRVKRRTPGRKRKVTQVTTAALVKVRDIAKFQARIVPQTIWQTNPVDDKASQDELTWHYRRLFWSTPSDVDHCLAVDRNNNIVKRLVRKTVDADTTWRAPNGFRGQLDDSSGPIQPLEWITHTLASNANGGQRSILPVFGRAQTRTPLKSYRMYVQYAACQSLESVTAKYRLRAQFIPKPFLYYVFQMLVEAALVMKQGNGSATSPDPEWKEEIVHRDLKPDNIFLDYPDPSHFPKYPRPLVGDFGLSFLTSEADETNPYYWATAAGTHGYMPPEQTSFQDPIDKKPVDDFKILSPCNVWGIGAIMRQLVEPSLDMGEIQPTYVPDGSFDYKIPQDVRHHYGNGLCDLIEDCLKFEPEERISLQRLQEVIAGHIQKYGYVRNANAGQSDYEDNRYKLRYDVWNRVYRLDFVATRSMK